MSIQDAFPLPAVYINKYVWHSLKSLDPSLSSEYGSIIPFFPLADARGGDAGWGNKPYVVYDELMRARGKAFYVKHKVQIMYYLRAGAVDNLTWTNAIAHILDRQDASAEDINNYLAANEPDAGIYFHQTKAFQIDVVGEERMDLSVRQYYTSALIVECDYHITKDNGFN